jgi:flagellar biosynthesis protein FlhA
LALDPASARHLLDEINRRTGELAATGLAAVVVVSSEIRLPLKRFLEASCPRLVVLAFQELPAAVEIENAGIVTAPVQLARPEAHLKAAA